MDIRYPQRRRWSDERRIDIRDGRDVAYWVKFFGVEEQDLLVAIDKVGSSAEKVRQHLQSGRTHDWIVDGGRQERRRNAPHRRHFPGDQAAGD